MEKECIELEEEVTKAKNDLLIAEIQWAERGNLRGCKEETAFRQAQQIYDRRSMELANCIIGKVAN